MNKFRGPVGPDAAIALVAFALTLGAVLPTRARAQAAAPEQASAAPAAPLPTSAQVDAGAAPTPAGGVVQMNPFEVQSSAKDIGYYTQNTVDGSRLNTKLGDLGASITVVTKQQMEDTSSINLNDMFLYEASTEGTENYTATGGFGKGAGVGDTIQSSPQTSTRIRGLTAPDISRDFFLTNPAIQTDAYNIDSVEIDRGPNSTLFGIGSPSGIVNLSIEKAVLNKDSNEISARYGRFDDVRTSFNLNRSLITDRMAIAVAGLYQNTHPTGQEPAYDIQRREFAALTLKPTTTTVIRANVEYYDNPNRRANSLTPADEVTPWFNAGRPTWDPITYSATVNGTTTSPITNNLLLPAGLVPNLGNWGVTVPSMYVVNGQLQLWEQAELGTNFAAVGTPTNAVGSVNGTGVNAVTNTWGPIGFERLVTTGGNYTKFATTAPAGQVTYPLFHEPGISNPQLLNWQGVNMISNNVGEDKAQTYNVEIEQQIGDNLFLEAGWYREQFTSAQHNYQGGNVGNAVMIDPNTRLLNGAPNPYFGRPFIVNSAADDVNLADVNEQERVALTYQLDFTKNTNWTKWLGRHNALAFYQHRENDTNFTRYREQIVDAHSWSTTTDIGAGGAGVQSILSQRFYLSNSGSAVSFGPGEFVNSNFTYPITWYNTALNGGTWTNESTHATPALNVSTTAKNQQQVWSYAGGLQDYFFDDRLVLTFGQRHDYVRNRSTLPLTNDPATGYADTSNFSQFTNWISAGGITREAGGVLHLNKWLSVHYNQSNNFQVASLGEDGFGNVLPNPSGVGKDYGVAISFFDDKLVAEMNWYKASAANSRQGALTYVQRALRTDYGGFLPWAQEVATNTLGPNATATAINNYAQTIFQFPTGLAGFANGTQFGTDTQTVQAKGWEFNLIYNPLRNWTMKFTADEDRAVDSNVFPHIQDYLAQRLPVWTKATDPILGPFWTTISADRGGGGIFSIAGAGTPQQWLAGTVDAAGLDVQLAQQGHDQPDLSKYHFNYLTNYQFVDGTLSGFGIGTALRYESPAAIGYLGAAPDASALGAIDGLQAFNPIYGKEVLHQDLWISYRTKLPYLDRRVQMTVQLNCRDLWADGSLLTVGVNPDGTPLSYRIIPPRQYFLTLKFDF